MEETKTLSYATVNFAKKKALKITAQQYLYLDSIRVLQANPKYNGWAYASNSYYAEMFDMSVRGIQKMSKLLAEKGLLKIGKGSLRQLTQNCYEIMTHEQSSPTNKVHPKHEQSSPLNMNKVHPKHEQSSPNNKSDSNNDNKSDSNADTHPMVLENRRKAQEYAEQLKQRVKVQTVEQFIDYFDTNIDLSDIGRWREMSGKQRNDFINQFAEYWVLGQEKVWNNKKDLKSHLISSLRRYTPQVKQQQQEQQNSFYRNMKRV